MNRLWCLSQSCRVRPLQSPPVEGRWAIQMDGKTSWLWFQETHTYWLVELNKELESCHFYFSSSQTFDHFYYFEGPNKKTETISNIIIVFFLCCNACCLISADMLDQSISMGVLESAVSIADHNCFPSIRLDFHPSTVRRSASTGLCDLGLLAAGGWLWLRVHRGPISQTQSEQLGWRQNDTKPLWNWRAD